MQSKARKKPSFWLIAVIVIIVLFGVVIIRGCSNVQEAKEAYQRAHPTPPPGGWARSDGKKLDAMLNKIFAPALANSGLYSLAVLDARGDVIYDNAASTAVVPASVLKLIVGDVALNDFGNDYHFVTTLAGAHPVGSTGVLDGDLWLVGGGDPSLKTTDLRDGVNQLSRSGLHEITGGVAIDISGQEGPEFNPHWLASDAGEGFQAPTSAISIDGNTLEHVDANGRKTWTALSNMPAFAGNLMTKLLREDSIKVDRPTVIEPAPMDSVALWQHSSAPMTTLIRWMWRHSDNHYAEQLFRALGGRMGKAPDDDNGIAVETAFLRAHNIPIGGLFLVDGSGLADANRVSALTLGRLLNDAQLRGGDKDLYPLLPLGGKEGTLRHYHFHAAANRVRAKTGHLAIADSLAGYLDTTHHGRISFVFMINNAPASPDATYARALDAMSVL